MSSICSGRWVERTVMGDVVTCFVREGGLWARDALQAATCAIHGFEGIASVDLDLDDVADVRCVPPEQLARSGARRPTRDLMDTADLPGDHDLEAGRVRSG